MRTVRHQGCGQDGDICQAEADLQTETSIVAWREDIQWSNVDAAHEAHVCNAWEEAQACIVLPQQPKLVQSREAVWSSRHGS